MVKRQMTKNEALAFVFIIFMVLGTAFTLVGVFMVRDAYESESWPTAEGRITQSYIESHTKREDGKTKYYYTPIVAYTFKVGSVSYTGDRVSFGGTVSYGLYFQAEQYLDDYPVGAVVIVHYDPANPEKCCLEPGLNLFNVIFLVVGVPLLGAGLLTGAYILVYLVKRSPDDTTEHVLAESDQSFSTERSFSENQIPIEITCGTCGGLNTSQDRFCSTCGAELRQILN